MELMTITEVTRTYAVSTRMIRYYEKMGLLSSRHIEDYAYRVYDEEAIGRLQDILILRKLRISLKEIAQILEANRQEPIMQVFRKNIDELENEMQALQTIRVVLEKLVSTIQKNENANVRISALPDEELLKIMEMLSPSTKNLKEEYAVQELDKVSLDKANEVLSKLGDVRIVLLPPSKVASYHYIGENPEDEVGKVVDEFVRESKIYEKKPDARMYGFNHPNPSLSQEFYGYEEWVTIPDTMDVPLPMVEKYFSGGLYAAHTITFPNFHEWKDLSAWVESSEKYESNYSDLGEQIMGGCLEEHLNWVYSAHMGWPKDGIDGQIDLLLPIRVK